ncbi:hypothetical protein ABL78_8136 [Leptomonas seymouri]|uniref:AP180 N-terminal homology (ANTH) domain-containing protein n=1 Tax=Leptomonas seymouri TaxID=5684 RepID=A0A0N1HYK2_LEPSE|nr:hypothetical protein ABL78_8136 [Leptomonas seymouri]|eukprot:KPI82850.1 hypothetical protein ABL78_8136 [Leptomonas seymouri]
MNKSEFKKAVADNEAPTPGYLYRDMASWTHVDYATRQQLIKALFDKLQTKNSAFVLHKTLHLIKVLCETGHEGFQKELQLSKYTNIVKGFTTYRGPLDIKYGDSWNEKVRCKAQDALEAIFQTRIAGSTDPTALGGTANGDWRGTGSSSVVEKASRGLWGCGGDSTLPGFFTGSAYCDNSSLQPPPQQMGGPSSVSLSSAFETPSLHIGEMPLENKWVAHQREMAAHGASSTASSANKSSKTLLQQLASKAKSGVDLMTQFEILKSRQERLYGDQFGQAARASACPESAVGLLGGRRGVDEVGSYQPVGFSVPMDASLTVEHASTLPPPIAPLLAAGHASSTSSSPQPSRMPPHDVSSSSHVSGSSSPAPESSASSDAVEARVHSLARMRETPSRVELSRLLHIIEESAAARAQSGAPLRDYGVQLASALGMHLAKEKQWQERLNALVVLEAVLRGSSAEVHDGVKDFYARQPHLVQVNYSVVQVSLKARAGKVAQLLKISLSPTSAAPVAPSKSSECITPDTADMEASGSQPSRFADLLGGDNSSATSSSPYSNPSATPAAPPTALWGTVDQGNAFEGMTIRAAESSILRRSDPLAGTLSPLIEARGTRHEGDSASRPQRRTNRAAAILTDMPLIDASEARITEDTARGCGGGAGSIQVLRHVGGTSGSMPARAPAGALAAQHQHHQQQQRAAVSKGGDDSDNLQGLFSVAPSVTPATSTGNAPTTLDDLFGGQPEAALQNASSSAKCSDRAYTDDLFAAPLSSSSEPPSLAAVPSPQFVSAAQLARIQSLMQYLETHYDQAAMVELEGLILRRQQELQYMATQQGVARRVLDPSSGATAAAEGTSQPHRQFQMGGSQSRPMTEHQQANRDFADVQAEMKRKMDL